MIQSIVTNVSFFVRLFEEVIHTMIPKPNKDLSEIDVLSYSLSNSSRTMRRFLTIRDSLIWRRARADSNKPTRSYLSS